MAKEEEVDMYTSISVWNLYTCPSALSPAVSGPFSRAWPIAYCLPFPCPTGTAPALQHLPSNTLLSQYFWGGPGARGGKAHLCGRRPPHRRHWARRNKHQPIQRDTGTRTRLSPECRYLCFYMETGCRGSPGSETDMSTHEIK